MAQDKVYFGRGKVFSGKFGDMTSLSFSRSEVKDMLMVMDSQGGDWISINVKKRREADKFGNTLYGELYVKDAQSSVQKPIIEDAKIVEEEEGGLPF